MADSINMADPNKSSTEEQLKNENDMENRARPLVSLPNIILTRIDPAIVTSCCSTPTAMSSKQKPKVKNVSFKNNNKNQPSKATTPMQSNIEKRSRGRPKKINSFSPKSPQKPVKKYLKNGQQILNKTLTNEKPSKKTIKNENPTKKTIKSEMPMKKLTKNEHQTTKNSIKNYQQSIKKSTKNDIHTVTKEIKKTVNNSNTIVEPQISATKAMLRRTMLQKKKEKPSPYLWSFQKKTSQVKKPKSIKTRVDKQTPVKVSKSVQLANKIHPTPQVSTDSSEDEFLYDELISEFENTFNKGPKTHTQHTESEKTTNITLKPSKGNKPPTVVKGGIIKMDSLPADLKTIASSGQLSSAWNKTTEQTSRKRSQLTNCPTPSKKPSPWPISISRSPNTKSQKIVDTVTKKSPTSKIISVNTTVKSSTSAKSHPSNNCETHEIVETAPPVKMPGRPKIGPKQMTKVVSTPQPLNNDNFSEDEYTEEETLENLDYLIDENQEQESPKKNAVDQTSSFSNIPSVTLTITPVETVKDDEDPNIDLLRILTDDAEDCSQNQPEKRQDKGTSTGNDNKTKTINNSMPGKEPIVEGVINEEPKERTIYDLVNEISLQRPSWNLHIIPETNAFCIAQVTKGRLGLPTLKKCIELDPEDYTTKVYIHQYHIKRFDGVYDSEESILALIDEIDSIKA